MNPPAHSTVFALVTSSLLAATALAQAPNPPASPGEAPPPTVRRILSPRLSSAISDGITYQPSAAPAQKAEAEKPKNTIIRLPEHVVEGERPPLLSERELHRPDDLLKLARRRYLGHFHTHVLNRMRLFGGDDVYALQRFADDERLAHMAAFNDKLYLYRIAGEDAEVRKLEREMRWTFLRHSRF